MVLCSGGLDCASRIICRAVFRAAKLVGIMRTNCSAATAIPSQSLNFARRLSSAVTGP